MPFAKGAINLKKLLFYNPDINNELDEPDLLEFRGIKLDMNKVQVYKGAENIGNKAKGIPNKNRATVKSNANNPSKLASAKKTIEEEYKNNRNNKSASQEKKSLSDHESPLKENSAAIKKTIRVRLTDEEYRLFMRFKAKRTITIQNK